MDNKSLPKVINTFVHPESYESVIQKTLDWVSSDVKKYICAANVHMVMEGYDDPAFQEMVNSSGITTPDGMPLVWMVRRLGYPDQQRVYGPTLTEKLLPVLAERGISCGFYGSTPEVLEKLKSNLKAKHPDLRINYLFSPPFSGVDTDLDQRIVAVINSSGVKVLFVGLGCPKQERWMYEHRQSINAVMLGVGAAFDFIAGIKPQAPAAFQKAGLEWFYRLITEPKRLWKRYLVHNPRFVILALRQLTGLYK